MEIIEQIFTLEFILTAGGVYFFFLTLKKSFPELWSNKWTKRFLPLLTLLLPTGVIGFIPGLSEFPTLGARLMHGLICGWASQNFYKILDRTVLGKGTSEEPLTAQSALVALVEKEEEPGDTGEEDETPSEV